MLYKMVSGRRPFQGESVATLLSAILRDTPRLFFDFAPRSRVPTLMVNGTGGFLTPFELAQQPLFRLLAAPASQKRHTRRSEQNPAALA